MSIDAKKHQTTSAPGLPQFNIYLKAKPHVIFFFLSLDINSAIKRLIARCNKKYVICCKKNDHTTEWQKIFSQTQILQVHPLKIKERPVIFIIGLN